MTKKTLKDFLEVYKPKSPDEQKFVDKHVVIKHKDRNGNGDDVFKGNTKTIKRKEERHGYDVGEDEKVYEEVEEVEEARVWHGDYNATSELSQFGGHRPKVVHKEKGHTMYLGQHAYRKPEMARKHAEAYLSAYSKVGPRAADNASLDFARANKEHMYKEDVDIEAVLDEALDLLMSIDEKTLTPAEMKKREEVVKAIKRDDPKMDKSMAYAIATKTAKRVAEGTMPTADEPTDANKKTAQRIRDLLAKEKKPVKEEVEGLDESAKVAAHLIKRYGDNVRKSHVRSAANDFGVGYVALSHAVRKKLGVNRLEEEQIDEISQDTAKAYYSKALDSGVKATQVQYKKGASSAEVKAANAVAAKRGRGLKMASKKMTQEEVEQVDEISKATMGRYINKAKDSIDLTAWRQGHKEGGAGNPSGALEKKLSKRHKGIETAVKKLTREESEQIDEISKKLATSFLDKTEPEVDFMSGPAGKQGHQKGRKLAFSKLARHSTAKVPATNEEAELEEGMQMWKVDFPKQHAGKAIEAGSAHVKAQNVSHAHKVMAKRLGVDHKLLKAKVSKSSILPEEAEQIDELSKKTLGNYTYKAASELGSKGITTGLKIAADEPTEKNFKKMANRQRGVATAVKKLTKEDIINRTIDKYVPEEVKFTPEERLLKRLDGLSEAHVITLLGLFEALNKDNQNKMIETVETRQGVNQLLNFALENRGE